MYTTQVNPNINDELWVEMISQCPFSSCKKRTALLGDIANGERYAFVVVCSIWEISLSSDQFFCEPKTTLKIKHILKCLKRKKIELS